MHPLPTIVHLTASTCYGGPERQMLELGKELTEMCRSVYVSFLEGGRCWEFLCAAEARGFASFALGHDMPRLLSAVRELVVALRNVGADLLCCHGYKSAILGRIAARRVGIPVVAVSRGWTGESARIRFYEILDRWNLRWMDRVVCVSQSQAAKVRRAGVSARKITTICNAIRPERFERPDPVYRQRLLEMFPRWPARIIGAAGRLSPEKGFAVLVDAAAEVLRASPSTGFALFGEGRLRAPLAEQIAQRGLSDRFILAGFHRDLDQYLPHFDLMVLPSFTEGLPNVVLEALAAGVPVVATTVGGTPEVLDDGKSGYLVPPGDAAALARRITDVFAHDRGSGEMGAWGKAQVRQRFSFVQQRREYLDLFKTLGLALRTEHVPIEHP